MNIEELGRDSTGKVSSQPLIKSGKDRGYRLPETEGEWICCGGYAYESRQEVKWPHQAWIKVVTELGHRVGSWDYDGVKNFYILNGKKK